MSEMQKNAVPCRRIPLSVNSSTQRPVMPDDPDTELRSGELPELVVGETVVFCLSFLNPDGTPFVFSGNEVFELSGDSDYDHKTGLMFYAGPDQMNLPGDWAESDPAQGKISLRVNCNTEKFTAKLEDRTQLPVFLEVRMTAADAVTRSILLRTEATAVNTIHSDGEIPEAVLPEYYTAAQIEARLNTKAEEEHSHNYEQISGLADVVADQIEAVEQQLAEKIEQKAEKTHTHDRYVEADYVKECISVAVPAGTVIAYAGSIAPDGFIACNGAEVSRETYAELFYVIGTTFGEGDGSTTFNLPDLTDRMVQGSATAGTTLAAGLPNIIGGYGNFRMQSDSVYQTGALYASGGPSTISGMGSGATALNIMVFDASKYNPIYGRSASVQPPALTMIYCIKY